MKINELHNIKVINHPQYGKLIEATQILNFLGYAKTTQATRRTRTTITIITLSGRYLRDSGYITTKRGTPSLNFFTVESLFEFLSTTNHPRFDLLSLYFITKLMEDT